MADDVKDTAKATDNAVTDAVVNLKGEMDRKLGNMEKTNASILSQLQNLVKSTAPAPKKAPTEADIGKLLYDDTNRAVQLIEDRATTKVLETLTTQNKAQVKINNTIASLHSDFPELQDMQHPLSQKAVQIYENFTEEEKQSPLSYKLAVKDAAAELNILPRGKRTPKDTDDDNFSLGGGTAGTSKKTKREAALDPRTVEFGRLMGLDMDDPKRIESLKVKAARKSWNSWQ